jgi:type IV pilus assembly protein PilQ
MKTISITILALLFSEMLLTAQEKPSQESGAWSSFCCWEKGRVEQGDLVIVVYDIHHSKTNEFHRVLTPYLTKGKGRIEYSDALQTLVITDTKANIGKMEALFKLVHHVQPPIQIEAKVVEIKWTKGLQLGLAGMGTDDHQIYAKNSGSGAFLDQIRMNLSPQEAIASGTNDFQGSTFRFTRSKYSLDGLFQMFQKRGKAQILSQPRILVKADETAKFFAGEEVPYPKTVSVNSNGTTTSQYTYRSAGISLEVTPHQAAPGQIILKIKPEVTTTLAFIYITPDTKAPEFSVRRVETEVLVRDGQEVVIGGLYRKEKTYNRRGIPFLMDIPILGYLFSRHEESEIIQEVLFFIKPTVIRGEVDLPKPLIDPGK